MSRKFVLASLMFGALLPSAALADEVWVMPSGNQLVYDRDIGDTAVLTYTPEQGMAKGQIFVVGLGGKYDGRGEFDGYWVEEDDAGAHCAAGLIDAQGKPWRRWGLAHVSFEKKSFPSRLTVTRGECLKGAVGKPVTAKPVVGAGVR